MMHLSKQLSVCGHAGKPRREMAVKTYEEVDLPGDVTEFVRSRGLRAPLLLLAGLAASAAQTAEPLWPVSAPSCCLPRVHVHMREHCQSV